MANLKSLAKETFIYGVSSIIGRFLNYLIFPIYTIKMAASTGSYGVITNVYAYTALLLVILTFGMETTFFRFSTKEGEDAQTVYSTTLIMVGGVCLAFAACVLIFIHPLSALMKYPNHPEYIGTMFVCVALDAFQCIPYAYLRARNRPIKFASLKLLFIFMSVTLNLLYFVVVPMLYAREDLRFLVSFFYDGHLNLAYAFYINLFCTGVITFFFYKELTGFKYRFDKKLAFRMCRYSWPILALGIAGILNQTADKILFPYFSPLSHKAMQVQLGIYGAAVKIAMIMTLITQAFRYAYEPFVFNKSKEKNNKETYAAAMKFFVIFTLLAFLVVIGFLPLLKHMIGPGYWGGLKVTPIVMAAGILLGVYFNLSLWYKLVDKTIFGMWFSFAGCAVLVLVNYFFIPRCSYMACAWGGVAGYGVATLLSYFVGQIYYPINYPVKRIGAYVLFTAVLYCLMAYVFPRFPMPARLLLNALCMLLFLLTAARLEFKSQWKMALQKILRKKQ